MDSTKLRIAGVVENSIADGPGFRYTVFTQGCPHYCPGCHNPHTHDFAGGYLVDVDELVAAVAEDPLLAGVTISGGEPFCQAAACAQLAQRVHELGLNVLVFSGWTLEQLQQKAADQPDVGSLLQEIDILIDGPFVQEQKDLTLSFRGSRNQRILQLKNGQLDKIIEDAVIE